MAVIRFHTDADGRVIPCTVSGCERCQSRTFRYRSAADANRPTAFLDTGKPAVRAGTRKPRRASGRVRDRAPDGFHFGRDGIIPDAPMPAVHAIFRLESERDTPGPSAAVNAAMWPRKWAKSSARPFTPTAAPPHLNMLPHRGSLRETAAEMARPQSADGGN